MTKKSNKDRETDDEKDLEEEEAEDEAEDEEAEDEAEDEEEEEAKPARAVAAPRGRSARTIVHHARDDHGHAGEEAAEDEEDPYWWTPHAVLSVLVLVGVLGFFGAFNKFLAPLFGKPVTTTETTTTEHTTGHQAAEAPKPMPPMPQQMQQPRELFGAKHLLVMYKGSLRAPANIERTKEEAKARATEAMKKAKEGKVKFEELVKEYSDEPGAAARGGDLGRFPKGAMVPAFQEAVEKIKVGEVSGIVETQFGYHVILRTQ